MVPIGTEVDAGSDRASQAQAFAETMVTARSELTSPSLSPFDREKNRSVPRRTPRVSLIVVLPENHVVSPERLAARLRAHGNQDIDIVVACAGQPTNLSALQRSVGDAQFLLAPAGTTTEDLRELAMRQAPGDIVTLLSGALLPADADAPLVMLS
ncbi:MAG: hypothetical protein QOD47_390 [Gemmatimonadaceae bacterium]|jgi:hypothetical protein|nr:hypothetical protein [Gemmatimonadaceae bacterium]